MARKVSSESEMQEVFRAAGNRLLVVHFYDDDNHLNKKLREIAKSSGGSFHLAEINKFPDPNHPNNKELRKNTDALIEEYMPPSVTSVLVFFRNGQRVRIEDMH